MTKMARYLDYLLKKWKNPKGKVLFKDELDEENKEEENIMIDYGDEDDNKAKKRDFITENKEF